MTGTGVPDMPGLPIGAQNCRQVVEQQSEGALELFLLLPR